MQSTPRRISSSKLSTHLPGVRRSSILITPVVVLQALIQYSPYSINTTKQQQYTAKRYCTAKHSPNATSDLGISLVIQTLVCIVPNLPVPPDHILSRLTDISPNGHLSDCLLTSKVRSDKCPVTLVPPDHCFQLRRIDVPLNVSFSLTRDLALSRSLNRSLIKQVLIVTSISLLRSETLAGDVTTAFSLLLPQFLLLGSKMLIILLHYLT